MTEQRLNGDARWTLPLGTAAGDGWEVAVTDAHPSWQHTSLRVTTLAGPESRELDGGDWEYIVVPLSGGVHVTARTPDGSTHEAALTGRPSVFAGPTDVAYVPAGSRITLRPSTGTARVALAGALVSDGAKAADGSGEPEGTGEPEGSKTPDGSGAREGATPRGRRPFRHVAAAEVPVERRGAGTASREVRNFGIPGVLGADAIIACEVITPAGNWSSWPPHKHDVERPGAETALEEIYYFETQSTDPRGTDPVGYQRVYASSPQRPIDVLAEVRTGDVVLVPHGWHGPSMAAPDAHLYYLNVMAGPGPERAWLICDDPAHAWVRGTWPGRPFDGRLPLFRTASGDSA